MIKRKWLILLALAGIALSLTMTPEVSSAGPGVTRDLLISAKAFEYTPGTIRVNQGDTIKVTLVAEDVSHGFYVDGYDVNIIARPRENASIEFVADKAGKYRFRCSETCGTMHPFMIGELIVEPNNPLWSSFALVGVTTLGMVLFLGLRKEQ
ncbi:MAG: cupredoxin domain-containing protein [Chloroflexi bacterium]|nr:cupredoxin domain-containing protein [Chloroflexota bacterium]